MLTVTGLRRRLAAGNVTPFELLDACTDRLAHTEHRVRAWVTPDPEGARRAAHALDPAARTDVAGAPLWGIPVGVKDIVDVAGLPTTASSRVLAGNVARRDAPVVTALRRGGAVVLGKTNTQEFAYGVVSPPTTNPWDPARIPGGSSGGSAAAVAAGHCAAALGSDTAGSIRVPAALCGICGLKPRPGILPLDGIVPLAPTLDVAGPMAATVTDLAVLWRVLAGVPPPAPVRLTDVRIGVVPEQSLPPITPGVGAAVDAALGALGAAGGRLETAVSCPGFGEFDQARTPVLMWEALSLHRARGWWPDRAADYTDETRTYLEYTERTGSEAGAARARAECAALSARLRAAVAVHGILVTPTAPEEAPTHGEAARLEDGSARRPVVRRLTRIPGPVNAARLAALSVPCGRGAGGLPVGLQLIGPDEATLLAAGMAIERELGWAPTSPPGGDSADEALD